MSVRDFSSIKERMVNRARRRFQKESVVKQPKKSSGPTERSREAGSA